MNKLATRVKIITVALIDVRNGTQPSLEEQVNEFIAVLAHDRVKGFAYTSLPGFQSVLISYLEEVQPEE